MSPNLFADTYQVGLAGASTSSKLWVHKGVFPLVVEINKHKLQNHYNINSFTPLRTGKKNLAFSLRENTLPFFFVFYDTCSFRFYISSSMVRCYAKMVLNNT